MHLGLFLQGTGNHPAAWRQPGAFDSFTNIEMVRQIAQMAERAKFDMIFMSDHLHADPKAHPSFIVRFEPLTMLGAIAMVTSHIGLGATVSTTYSDPFTVARAFAAFQRGDHATAIDLIVPMLPERERMGGSRAQVDLVEATLLRAYLGSGRGAEAQRLLADRRPGPARLPIMGLEQGVASTPDLSPPS